MSTSFVSCATFRPDSSRLSYSTLYVVNGIFCYVLCYWSWICFKFCSCITVIYSALNTLLHFFLILIKYFSGQ